MLSQFARLLEELVHAPSRNRKVALLAEQFSGSTPDDFGYALAALRGKLAFKSVKAGLFRTLIVARMDPVLFALSYDFVGDLAETISLCWPSPEAATDVSLTELVNRLHAVSRSDAPAVLESLLDRLDASGRFALIKLATGGLRVGVSDGVVLQALAVLSGQSQSDIQDVWDAAAPPYGELVGWLRGEGGRPQSGSLLRWRGFMLAHPLDEADIPSLDPSAFVAEWKWDGIRVQAVSDGVKTVLYSRSGEDISAPFPEIMLPEGFSGAIDGELLALGYRSDRYHPGSFNDLQQRLNRKSVPSRLRTSHPVFLRAYDLLMLDGADLRSLPLRERRRRLEQALARLGEAPVDLSEQFSFERFDALDELRRNPPDPAIEGVMLKRLDSAYVSGRVAGLWHKWKKAPMTADVVLLYAQRGHGKRSGLYSDYTFGAWAMVDDARILLPVGKAYSGFTDAELAKIDKYVRENTIDQFGPVRAVRADASQGLVFEIEFEGIGPSTRHKSGIALRFPRVSRLRFDKPAAEADTIETLRSLFA